jgi:hypothetical protein
MGVRLLRLTCRAADQAGTAGHDPFRTSGIIEWPMPADIRSFEDLERFVPQAAEAPVSIPKSRCRDAQEY